MSGDAADGHVATAANGGVARVIADFTHPPEIMGGAAAAGGARPHPAPKSQAPTATRANAKGLHIELEARPGRVPELLELISTLRGAIQVEPNTRPWFGLRQDKRRFAIFETFPNEAARKRHLSGQAASEILSRSNQLLKRPARVTRVDVLEAKTEPL